MNKIKFYIYSLASSYSTFLLNIQETKAQIGLDPSLKPNSLPGGQVNTQTPTDVTPEALVISSVGNIINLLMLLSGSLAVFFIVYSGFQYVASRGEDSEISKAKNTLTWVIYGLIIMFFAMAIVRFILSITLSLEEVN